MSTSCPLGIAFAVRPSAVADIPKWDFGFFTINMIGYQAQVIPAMLAAFTLVYLEKFFRKICPPVISMIVVPFCSLVLSVIIAHTVLGPIGWKIGTFISDIVYAGISGSFRVVFGAIFGFVYGASLAGNLILLAETENSANGIRWLILAIGSK